MRGLRQMVAINYFSTHFHFTYLTRNILYEHLHLQTSTHRLRLVCNVLYKFTRTFNRDSVTFNSFTSQLSSSVGS